MSDLEAKLTGDEEESRISFSSGCFAGAAGEPSTVPALFIVQVVFMLVVTIETQKANRISASEAWHVFGLLIILGAWCLTSALLSLMGAFKSPRYLKSFPGAWLPLIPLVLSLVYCLLAAPLKDALVAIVDYIDSKWFVIIHGLRVLAVGTVIKAIRNTFPKWFGLIVGGLDMLYGISAWILFVVMMGGTKVFPEALFIWHLLGVLVVVPPAPLMIQLSLPGWNLLESDPHMSNIFRFPMVLAPSLVVPLFVAFNLLVVWRIGAEL